DGFDQRLWIALGHDKNAAFVVTGYQAGRTPLSLQLLEVWDSFLLGRFIVIEQQHKVAVGILLPIRRVPRPEVGLEFDHERIDRRIVIRQNRSLREDESWCVHL